MGILPETSHGMEGVKKLARSQSIKLCEKLKIPVPGRERSSSRESNRVNNEGEEEEEDSSTPTKLPILRSFHSVSKQISEKKQTNGVASDCRGLVQYEDLLTLLTCLQCRCLVSPPVAQCRKGHLYCLSCKKTQQLSSCKICKQTFVDAPNQALEKMVGLIGLPCKYAREAALTSSSFPAGFNMKHSAGFGRLSANSSSLVVTRCLHTRTCHGIIKCASTPTPHIQMFYPLCLRGKRVQSKQKMGRQKMEETLRKKCPS